MKSFSRFFLILACAWASALHAQNTEQVKEIPSPMAMHEEAERQFLDQRVPVITMEQFYSGPGRHQGYRVRIFKSGETFYDGIKNVRTLGQQRLNIAPAHVEEILSEFKKYKFWLIPDDQLGRSPFSVSILEFTLRDGAVSKTVRFAGQRHAGMLQRIIENEVNTAPLRCPYIDDRGMDLCASFDRYMSSVATDFLKLEFSKLQEMYD